MELKQAQYALEGAKKALDNAKALYEERTQAKSQVDSANTEYKLAEARLRIAEAQYQKLASGARPLEIDASEAQMKAAEAKVKLIKARLQDSTIVSPVSGIVLSKHYNVGEVVAAGSPIIKIANTDKIRVHAEVDETDIEKLKVGQKAVITSRAFADRRFEGRVSKIGPQVRDKRVRINDPTLLQNDVKVLESKIELPFEPALKIGLPVEVKIIVKELDNVLIIPRPALVGTKHLGEAFGTNASPLRYYVEVFTANGYEKREVEIGEMDYDNAQVIRGLVKGDRVRIKD
jgi:RND family efflux transporter MFP subunit